MTLWRVSWRTQDNRGQEQAEDHDTETQALTRAEELARTGVLAIVYAIGGIQE